MKWLSVLVPIAIAAIDQFSDAVAPYVAAHPKVALFVGMLVAISGAVARSPLAKFGGEQK